MNQEADFLVLTQSLSLTTISLFFDCKLEWLCVLISTSASGGPKTSVHTILRFWDPVLYVPKGELLSFV